MKSGIWCTNSEYTPLSSGAVKIKSEVLDDLNLFKECDTFEEFCYKWNPEWSIRTDFYRELICWHLKEHQSKK